MKIEHVAIWAKDIEALKSFYETYFDAQSKDKYINSSKGFSSYFLSFESGTRLEIIGQGYQVKLFFLRLPTAEMAIARVTQRVREGGHDVPEAIIRRRFHSGWRNFETIYRDLADEWVLYDNSGEQPLVVAKQNQR